MNPARAFAPAIDDLPTARALIATLQDQLTKSQREIAALRHQLDVLCRRMFGKSSEKVDPNQLTLALEQLANEPGTVTEPIEMDSGETPVRGHQRQRPTGRRPLPAHLARERVLASHVGAGWLKQLDELYQFMSRIPHSPAPLPIEPCGTTPYDVSLAPWLEAQAWRPLSPSSHVVRWDILSDLATKLYFGPNRGDMLKLLSRLWRGSRRPGDLAIAAALTGVTLARAGRHSVFASRSVALRAA